MSSSPRNTSKKTLLSHNDYLSPLPLPTGQTPSDCLGIIWRKNDVFIDISSYNIGPASMIMWIILIITGGISYAIEDIDFLFLGLIIISAPALLLSYALWRPAPLPVRFNRQRREACILKQNGEYWIVPWEHVIATATQVSSSGQGGKVTHGMLFIGLDNPDPNATPKNKHVLLSFNCGGGETAMALWECVRSYMEVGPETVEFFDRFSGHSKGFWAKYAHDMKSIAKRKGWFLTLLWDGLIGIVVFNTLLADLLERWKLSPLPDLNHPDIIEWSKPLPPEQWAKPSPELQAALAEIAARQNPRA